MSKEFNPFTEQINVKYFVGREHLLKQFRGDLNGLRSGIPNHQFIAGLNGTGKTSVLAKLIEVSRSEGFLSVMPTLDAESLSRGHVATIMRSLIVGVQERLGNKGPKLVADWDKGKESKYFQHPQTEELKGDRIRQDFETIRRLLKEADIAGAVICIDEGQRIDGRAMSALKNSLQMLDCYLIVLSLRLASDAGGAVSSGRVLLETKAANEAEGDIGAARFYVTGIPIGPFDTDDEAAQCIKRRLCDNAIQFDDAVVNRIGRINGRIPKGMISLANNLYNDAKRLGETTVGVKLLDQTFRVMYRKEVEEAEALIVNSSGGIKSALKALLEIGQPSDCSTLAAHVHPGLSAEMHANVTEGIQGSMERACAASSFCMKTQDRYEISNPIYAYAVELALETAS